MLPSTLGLSGDSPLDAGTSAKWTEATVPFGLGRQVRFVTLGLVVVCVAVVAVLSSRSAVRPTQVVDSGSEVPLSADIHIVEPGETLWGIAVALAPERDPRPMVDALVEANGGASIYVGQKLYIPDVIAGGLVD